MTITYPEYKGITIYFRLYFHVLPIPSLKKPASTKAMSLSSIPKFICYDFFTNLFRYGRCKMTRTCLSKLNAKER